MEQNNSTASEQKQYAVSKQTAAIMDCMQELNNLTAHLQEVANIYNCRNIDEIMQPICTAIEGLQQAIIHNLIADSIAEAVGHCNITEV